MIYCYNHIISNREAAHLRTLVSWQYVSWLYTRQWIPNYQYPAFRGLLQFYYMQYFTGILLHLTHLFTPKGEDIVAAFVCLSICQLSHPSVILSVHHFFSPSSLSREHLEHYLGVLKKLTIQLKINERMCRVPQIITS